MCSPHACHPARNPRTAPPANPISEPAAAPMNHPTPPRAGNASTRRMRPGRSSGQVPYAARYAAVRPIAIDAPMTAPPNPLATVENSATRSGWRAALRPIAAPTIKPTQNVKSANATGNMSRPGAGRLAALTRASHHTPTPALAPTSPPISPIVPEVSLPFALAGTSIPAEPPAWHNDKEFEGDVTLMNKRKKVAWHKHLKAAKKAELKRKAGPTATTGRR